MISLLEWLPLDAHPFDCLMQGESDMTTLLSSFVFCNKHHCYLFAYYYYCAIVKPSKNEVIIRLKETIVLKLIMMIMTIMQMCVCSSGLVGACGISVLGNLMRVQLFIQASR